MAINHTEYAHNIGFSLKVYQENVERLRKSESFRIVSVTHQATLPTLASKRHFLDEYIDQEETSAVISYLCNKDLIENAPIVEDKIKLTDEEPTYLCFRSIQTSMEIWCPVISTNSLFVVLIKRITINGLGSQLEQAVRCHIVEKYSSRLYKTFLQMQSNSVPDERRCVPVCSMFFQILRQCLRINPTGPCLYCGSPLYGLPGRTTASIGDVNSDIAMAVDLNIPVEIFSSDTLEKQYPSLESSLPTRLYSFTEIGDSGAYTLPFYAYPSLSLCDNFVDILNFVWLEQGDCVPAIKSSYNVLGDDEYAQDLVMCEVVNINSKAVLQPKNGGANKPLRRVQQSSIYYPYHTACASIIKSACEKVDIETVLKEGADEIQRRAREMSDYYNKVVREVREKLQECARQNQQKQFNNATRYPPAYKMDPGLPPGVSGVPFH